MAPKIKPMEERKKLMDIQGISDDLLTKLAAWVTDHGKSSNLSTLKVQIEQAEDHYKKYMHYEEKLVEYHGGDDDSSEETDRSEALNQFVELYVKTKSRLLQLIEDKQPDRAMTTNDLNQSIVVNSRPVQLPKLQPPTFSGSYCDWLDFKNEFTSMIIDATDLNDTDRFRFLKSCLVDGARRTISQMEASKENFRSAWAALVERYENKALMFQSHINEIIQLKGLSKESADGLRDAVDKVSAHRRALSSLGSTTELADNLLICLVLNKMDSNTAMKWEESTSKDIPTFDGFIAFLEKRASTLEKIDYNRKLSAKTSNAQPRSSHQSKGHHSAFLSTNQPCVKCSSTQHTLKQCPQFIGLSPSERYDEIKQRRLCIICLKNSHRPRFCRAPRCGKCQQRHNTLLHFVSPHPQQQTPTTSTVPIQKALVASKLVNDNPAILATAIVDVIDDCGFKTPCRVLLDSCATTNFLSERFAQTINIRRQKDNKCIGGIGSNNTISRATCCITFSSRYNNTMFNITASILQKITDAQPPYSIDVSGWNAPKSVTLADPSYNKPQYVDLLIGAGLFWHILLPNRIISGDGLPIVQETLLGWIVSGPTTNVFQAKPAALLAMDDRTNNLSTQHLSELVQRFWEVDNDSTIEPEMSLRDIECERHYVAHTRRDHDGSYIVRLPFSKNPNSLGESLSIAMRRFLNLEKRLNKQPELKKMYVDFIKEYEELNHLEVVTDFDSSKPHYFLPHHCVLKMSSTSTKLRVVFDGSCKTSTGLALNDILHTGIKMQDDLFIILLRFRLFQYVLTGDIQKMYRQVKLDKQDRNFQFILWRTDESDEVQILRLSTVTYGTAPGSFLAIRTLHQLADDESDEFPTGATILRKNFYVDDMMTGADSKDDLMEIKTQVTEILRRGGFTLSKFCSNDDGMLSNIEPNHREKFVRVDEKDIVRTLGLIWQPETDTFHFAYQPGELPHILTKRIVLSELASLFDPLGLVCPVITMAKIFFQELWKMKLGWDTALDSTLSGKWERFRSQLLSLREINIPRFVMAKANYKSVEIHSFSDASEKSYGVCIYLRCIHESEDISCRLLCAKSKVAPTKTISIARLELLGAKMMSDVVARLKRELLPGIPIHAEYYWCDSMITLCWIKSEPHKWNIFIANRVTKIQESTSTGIWRHIPGDLNPADLITRGMLPEDLAKSNVWFHGPDFLYHDEQYWPSLQNSSEFDHQIEEKRPTKFVLLSLGVDDLTAPMNYSVNFRGIKRVFAYVFLFARKSLKLSREHRKFCTLPKCRDHRKLTSYNLDYKCILQPTPSEEEEAEMKFIKVLQQSWFAEDYQHLQSNEAVSNSSLLKSLAPFLDDAGIIRVGGRLKKAHIAYDSKHQILLPKNHRFTKSLIMFFHHFRSFHAGPHVVLTAIRSRYWPLSGITLTRSILRECVWCFRMRPKILHQIMGELPRERLGFENIHPFRVSGVDFAGPLHVRHHIRCKVPKKVYVALFICLSTKAVHLELVIDLSTEAFIRALKRFIADRGKITKIFSDNATNFQGTANQLREIKKMLLDGWQDIKGACSQDFVEWSFIPPRSPNFGGLWEASIKIAKRLIRNVVGCTELTVDELHTIIRQVAAIINSRPITPISADPNDLEPLTPGHFIYGGPPSAFPEEHLELVNINRIKLHQRMSYISQQFWKRFEKEYLCTLQHRTKWMVKQKNIETGMMVLLKDDSLPPMRWSLGRIVSVTPDKDGNVRVVKVKTATGIFDRSISGVAVLPMEQDQTSS